MAGSVTAYLRIPEELKQEIDNFATGFPGRPSSEVLTELIRRGLRFSETEKRMGEFREANNDARYRLERCETLVREYYKQSNELGMWFGAYRQVADRDPAKATEYLLALAGAVGMFLAGKPDLRTMRQESGIESVL